MVGFLGELASGLLPASTPELAAGLGTSGATAAAIALAAPLVLATLVEPWLCVIADRAPDRRTWIRAGLLALAAACLAAAFAPGWGLAFALAAAAPLWGVGEGVSQVALLQVGRASASRLLTRWTLACAVGDVAAPAVLVVVAGVGLDWRAGFVLVGLLAVVDAALVPSLPRGGGGGADDDEPVASARAAIAVVVRSPRLVAWIAGTFLCTLLDEIVIAFGALALAAQFGASPWPRAVVLGALLVGGLVGLVIQERALVRVDERRWLIALGATCTIAYLGWLAAPSVAASAVLAGVVGATTAGQYPLAKAFAYRAAGDRPGVVNAALSLLSPLEVAIPVALAVLAEAAGVHAALAVLAVQPAGLLVLAVVAPVGRDDRSHRSDG